MGRLKLYASAADRQAAYRLRIADQGGAAPTVPSKPRQRPSRPARLALLQRETQDLQHEYEAWLTSLPEALHDGDQGERLAETIEQLGAVADLLSEITPPRGYGRD